MAANIATDVDRQLYIDIDAIIESIQNDYDYSEVPKLNDDDRLAADSFYAVLQRSTGNISKTMTISNNRDEVLQAVSSVVDAFTNSVKCGQVQSLGAEDGQRVMLEWLSELVEYLGKNVLVDAEVIIIKSSDFVLLDAGQQYKYFDNTLSNVRKWFKTLRKKLKPFISPQ